MRYALLLLVFLIAFLIACTPQTAQQQSEPIMQCKWPEIIAPDGTCCRDLNENKVCDRAEFAKEIESQERQEYEERAEQARRTAEQAGKFKRTIINDLYDEALKVKNYRFLYKGDEIIVKDGRVTRKLLSEHPIGDRDVFGKRFKVVINTVSIDFDNKKATGTCVPNPELVRQDLSTPCDNFANVAFEVPFEDFAFKMPVSWLEDFLHRNPYQIFPGTHVGKLNTVMYRFTDLKDANKKTDLYVDENTKMPVRIVVRQGDQLVFQEEYIDLYTI